LYVTWIDSESYDRSPAGKPPPFDAELPDELLVGPTHISRTLLESPQSIP
jgi:hypothetical protein